MRFIYLFFIALFLAGCSAVVPKHLLLPSQTIHIATANTQIGVKEVTVPTYLSSNKIAIQEGTLLKSLGAKFASDPAELLTKNAIATLKQALNDPYVFLYPWDIREQKGYIVTINLDNFIYKNGLVYLEGSYLIAKANGKTTYARNFLYKRASKEQSSAIVKSLSTLFHQVVIEIAQKIAK